MRLAASLPIIYFYTRTYSALFIFYNEPWKLRIAVYVCEIVSNLLLYLFLQIRLEREREKEQKKEVGRKREREREGKIERRKKMHVERFYEMQAGT